MKRMSPKGEEREEPRAEKFSASLFCSSDKPACYCNM